MRPPRSTSARQSQTQNRSVPSGSSPLTKPALLSTLPVFRHFETGLVALLVHIALRLQYSAEELSSDVSKLRNARITTLHRFRLLRLPSLCSIGLSVLMEQHLADFVGSDSDVASEFRSGDKLKAQQHSSLLSSSPGTTAAVGSLHTLPLEHWAPVDTAQWLHSLPVVLSDHALAALTLPGATLSLLSEQQIAAVVGDPVLGAAVYAAIRLVHSARSSAVDSVDASQSCSRSLNSQPTVRAVSLNYLKDCEQSGKGGKLSLDLSAVADSADVSGSACSPSPVHSPCSSADCRSFYSSQSSSKSTVSNASAQAGPSVIVKKVKKENVRFTSTTKKYFIRWITKLSFDSMLSFIAQAYSGI